MYLLYDEDDQMIDHYFYRIMMQIKLIYHHKHKHEDFFQQQHKRVNEIYDYHILKEVLD